MKIRKLRPGDDFFAVSRVYEESWREAYRGLLPQEYLDSIPLGKWVPYLEQAGRESLLLLEEEKIVGTASCCASRTPELAGWGEIVSLYLLPEYWGNGWGKALLTAAVEQLESMGYQDFFLWVLEGNQRARAFYEHMGFRPSGAYEEDEIGGMPVREIEYRRERSGAQQAKKAGYSRREEKIRRWFSMWLDKQDTGIEELFAPDAVYIESWGPEYHGRGKIKLWFDGLSLIRWNEAGQICFLQEFGCNENRYDPYAQGDTPVFREEPALWF